VAPARILLAVCAALITGATGFHAQERVLPLWPEGVPNAQRGGGAERLEDGRVSNVHVPTLTYVPPAARPVGTAVIVAPGGGYARLAMSNEPAGVAERLSREGVATFILKYRLNPTPRSWPDFGKVMTVQMANWIGKPGMGLNIETPSYAVDDAVAALRLVRQRARTWKVDPARIGMVGFSAGARLTLATVRTASAEDMPAFIAPIYPPMETVEVPANAPPMFVAMATDDPLSGKAGFGLIQSWVDAGKSVEFHAFRSGGHGFGLGQRIGTTYGWIDLLVNWIGKVAPPPAK